MRLLFTQKKPLDPTIYKLALMVHKTVAKWARKLNVGVDIDHVDLSGACGIASYLLHKTLKDLSIKSTFVMGQYHPNGYANSSGWWDECRSNHCWLKIEDKIVDITAIQFGMDDLVFVTPATDDRYRALKIGKPAIEELLTGWDAQSPTFYQEDMVDILNTVKFKARVAA